MSAYDYQPGEEFALSLDAGDPLRGYREQFHIPATREHGQVVYFCGNSLGLQPKTVRSALEQELTDWANLAVDAHFEGTTPWFSYHDIFRESGARVVGAKPGEVVMMNSLTVNLHLMMASFYRPTRERYKILIDGPTFPSDTYAVKSQLQHHGYDAKDGFLLVEPREEAHTLTTNDIERVLKGQGEQVALMLIAGVNFFTGQYNDIEAITRLGHAHGCVVGFDLAHAAGNVPLSLHDCNVDFAAWCNYKYLNSGPGAVAGCFVHEKHATNTDLPRFAGWWGNDPDQRFKMHLLPEFVAMPSADGWQISNPPIMAMAPLKASMEIFDSVGMAALREKSRKLTGYLQYLLDAMPHDRFEVITPGEEGMRGCQLSIVAKDAPREFGNALQAAGVVGDFRPPNVIRVAPVPLYNSYHDAYRFAAILEKLTTSA